MRKMILHIDSEEQFHAGTKAMNDCEAVLCRRGYEILNIKRYSSGSNIGDKLKNEMEFRKVFSLHKGDILVLQHPLYIGTRYIQCIALAKKLRGFRVMVIIHDLESLRGLFKDFTSLFQKLDQCMLQTGDVFIAHNSKMVKYLTEERNVERDKIVNLQLFDYLVKEGAENNCARTLSKNIAIAGNFAPEKSGYVYKLFQMSNQIQFQIYGMNYEEPKETKSNICYHGAFPPDELPAILEGSFGLVWDGSETDTCSGNTGDYMRYNNPHKVSLYVAAGIPIIIWEQAALAEFVQKEQIGVVVDNLADLETKLEAVLPSEYAAMSENIRKLSERVREGLYISNACEQGERMLKEQSEK